MCGVVMSFFSAPSLAQGAGSFNAPEELKSLPKVGFALSCMSYTRRVAEKAFLEKGEASLEFTKVWLNASNRWLVEAVDAGAVRSDMARWIADVKGKPENTALEDYCFKQGTSLLASTSSDDEEVILKSTQNQLSLLRGRR